MKRTNWHWGFAIGLVAVLMGSSIGCNPTTKPTTAPTTTKSDKQPDKVGPIKPPGPDIGT